MNADKRRLFQRFEKKYPRKSAFIGGSKTKNYKLQGLLANEEKCGENAAFREPEAQMDIKSLRTGSAEKLYL